MFECKLCQQKQRDIDYLHKLIDNLLQKQGVAPVTQIADEEIKPEEPVKGDKYGD